MFYSTIENDIDQNAQIYKTPKNNILFNCNFQPKPSSVCYILIYNNEYALFIDIYFYEFS